MRCWLMNAFILYTVYTDVIWTILAGAPVQPVWNTPENTSFTFEFTESSGCDEVTILSATLQFGNSITFTVVSNIPNGGFVTEKINATSAKLTCNQAAVVDGTVYEVNVRAMDDQAYEYSDIVLIITASKLSVSDKQPVFVKPNPDPASNDNAISILETVKGGDTVYWLSAADPDTAFALLTYSMDNSDAITKGRFEISGNQLNVKAGVTEDTFDYDKEGAVRQYSISLEVSDGVFSSLLNTHINVRDVNDNAPVFETIPTYQIYENTYAGSAVFQVTASDADATDEYSQVRYSMTGSTDFTIDETTGLVSVASGAYLDYEDTSKYVLTVTASDYVVGDPLSSDAQVTITIITAPNFVNLATDATAYVSENAATDTSIFELTVTDKDQTESPTVTIINQTPAEMFRLDGYVLKLKAGVTLKADVQPTYKLSFSATDDRTEVTSAVLTVNVVKVETTTPKVNPAIIKSLSENAPPDTSVAKIDIGELNNKNDITFSINGGYEDFVIDSSTRKVVVAPGVQLDYTDISYYTLLVTATDGELSIVTPVIVNIKTSPVFIDPADSSPATTSISIPENTAPKTVIKSLTAQDEDSDTLRYYIDAQIPSTSTPVFEIRGASLRAASTLDTLDVDAIDAVLEYKLQLRVSDRRSISIDDLVNVTITITDSNEPPVFPAEVYSNQSILESTREGFVLFTVQATDADRTPENSRIRYSLSGTPTFDINPDTGDITLAIGAVLNKTEVPVYSFAVIATDGGLPAMSARVPVIVNIIRDGCNLLTDGYGTWPVTKIGRTSFVECQDLYQGNVSRVCDSNGVWGAVSSQCKLKEDVIKELKQQLELLSISTDDISDELEDISKNLTEITNIKVDGDGIANVIDLLQDVVGIIETTTNVTENGTEYFFETMNNLIMPDNAVGWNKTQVEGSAVLELVDRYVAVLVEIQCKGLNNGEVNEIEKYHLYTEVGRKSGILNFPTTKQIGSAIHIPEDTLTDKGITDICFGGSIYNSIGDILKKQVENGGLVADFSNGQEVNSDVISIQLQSKTGVIYDNLNPPVRVTLKLLNANLTDPICVFWDFKITNMSGGKGAWSPAGCVLVEITNETVTCECTHLTNFAILMSPSNISGKHSKILGIISAVGCAISMVCLILTIAAHCLVWRVVRSNRTITLMHLCVALFLALGIFLAGVNRTESPEACAAIAALIQYLFLAVFFLMLLIGIEILLSVIQVFGTKFPVQKLLPFAWLVPAIIVGVSMGVTKTDGYGNDRFCWLDIDSGLIWSFIGPVLFVIFVNVIIIAVVFKKITSSTVMKSKTSIMRIKTSVRSLCVLLPIMGLTWLSGILSVNSNLFILQYLFCICNTLQGLLIFLFHCVFNRQIREALKLRKERRKTLETFSSEFRHTKEEKSQSFKKDRNQSGSKGVENNTYISSNRRNEEMLRQHERYTVN